MTQKETSVARTNIASPPVPTYRRFEAFFPKNTVAVANTGAQQFTGMDDLDDPVRKTNVNVQCSNQAENLGYRITLQAEYVPYASILLLVNVRLLH